MELNVKIANNLPINLMATGTTLFSSSSYRSRGRLPRHENYRVGIECKSSRTEPLRSWSIKVKKAI
jgi:hypothetical protein